MADFNSKMPAARAEVAADRTMQRSHLFTGGFAKSILWATRIHDRLLAGALPAKTESSDAIQN